MKRIITIFLVLYSIPVWSYLSSLDDSLVLNKVVIDPGHGGKDPGNLGTGRYKVSEKDITLDVAKKLAGYIEKKMPDIEVILTRDDDSFPKLDTRVKIANDSSADLFISIHCDAFSSPSARGCGTYVMGMHKTEESLRVAMQENASIYKEDNYAETYKGFNPSDPDTYIALALRQNVYLDKSLELGSMIQNQFRDRVGRRDRGVRQAGYYVISYTSMPSVLVELGFLTNNEEEDFLISDDGQSYMASAIYRALRDYRQKQAPLSFDEEEKQDPATEPEFVETETNSITFKVQITSSPVKLEKTDPIFQGHQSVDLYISNGQYKYTIGNFKTADEAHNEKQSLRTKGFKGAFVVAFKNGKRIPMSEVPK